MLSHFSCVQLCNPLDCGSPGSSLHGILQTRMLEWGATSSSRESSLSRDGTHVSFGSCIAGRFFTAEPLGKSLKTTVLAHSSTTFKYILQICAPSLYLVCQSSTICWTFFQLLGLQHPKKTKFLPSTLVEETDNKLPGFDSVPH